MPFIHHEAGVLFSQGFGQAEAPVFDDVSCAVVGFHALIADPREDEKGPVVIG